MLRWLTLFIALGVPIPACSLSDLGDAGDGPPVDTLTLDLQSPVELDRIEVYLDDSKPPDAGLFLRDTIAFVKPARSYRYVHTDDCEEAQVNSLLVIGERNFDNVLVPVVRGAAVSVDYTSSDDYGDTTASLTLELSPIDSS